MSCAAGCCADREGDHVSGYVDKVLHLCAPNDRNGNPRRAFVVLFDDGVHAYFDEGYAGAAALPADYRPCVSWTVNVSAGELRRWQRESTVTVAGGAA